MDIRIIPKRDSRKLTFLNQKFDASSAIKDEVNYERITTAPSMRLNISKGVILNNKTYQIYLVIN